MGRSYTKMMLHLALDLVSFYSVLKKDLAEEIQDFSKDLKESCKDNPNIEIFDSGSGFEDLYLPHADDDRRVNVDADHMIIRNDIPICEIVNQGITKSKSDIRKTNTKEYITPNGIIFKNKIPFFDTKPQYTFKKGDILHMKNGCHQGYVFLSTDKSITDMKYIENLIEDNCLSGAKFVSENLKLVNIKHTIIMNDVGHRIGPSFTKYSNSRTYIMDRDFVFALKCKSWPHQAREWLTRHRQSHWPSEKEIKCIESSGCFVVPVASHNNTRLQDYEWRLSFSAAEFKLIKNLPENVKFGYAVMKSIVKYNLKRLQRTDFASYHLKTCLLWFLEKFGLEKMQEWTVDNIMQTLLEFLIEFYSKTCLPNYFVRGNNMIDHKDQAEIKQCVFALRDTKSNLVKVMIDYIDTHHKLLVEFDKKFAEYINFHDNEKISQLIKYNFLLMYLYHRLMEVADPSYIHLNKQFFQKARYLHKNYDQIHTSKVPLFTSFSKPNEELTVYDILELLSEYLETDNLSKTEKSGIALSVFNLVLVSRPVLAEKNCKETKRLAFDEYAATCSIFVDVLQWASLKHQLYADEIYEFVVKKWVNGPKLVPGNEKAVPFMKLLMVAFGKPTKQSKAFNGTLLKLKKGTLIFINYRYLVSFLLFYDIDLAYILYQGIAWLMNRTILDEIRATTQQGDWVLSKTRAMKLIMSHEELKNALTDEQRKYIKTFEISGTVRI